MLLIALLLSEREWRGGGWRDIVKEAGVTGRGMRAERGRGDRGGRAHCTALITAL